jgi:hypothetical protein
MTIQEIIQMLQNKYAALSQRKTNAFNEGELAQVMELDAQLEELLATIQKLQSVA